MDLTSRNEPNGHVANQIEVLPKRGRRVSGVADVAPQPVARSQLLRTPSRFFGTDDSLREENAWQYTGRFWLLPTL